MVISRAWDMGHRTSKFLEINGDGKEQMRLQKACKDFEMFLVSYLLRNMWQTAESVGGEKPFVSQAYRDLFTFEFAQSLMPSLKLGIAEMLYREIAGLSVGGASAPKGIQNDG